jgi:hypothetical protein
MFDSIYSRGVFLVASFAASLSAQDSTLLSKLQHRSSASLSFIQSRPQGAFRQNVGLAYGASGAYLLRLDAVGAWSIRADVGVVSYGAESREAALSNTVGDRIRFEVKTNHFIIPMSVGPRVMWPTGIVRPYRNAGIGAQVFETDSHAEAVSGESLTITTDQSDVAPLWGVGGGIYMPIYNGKTKVSLDFGMQYLNGGNAQYQTSGSIIDLPNAQIKLNPSRSVTHMIVVRFGARIGL